MYAHTLSLSLSLSESLTFTHTCTHTLSLALVHSRTFCHSLSPSLSLSLDSLSLPLFLSLSISLSLSVSISLSLVNTGYTQLKCAVCARSMAQDTHDRWRKKPTPRVRRVFELQHAATRTHYLAFISFFLPPPPSLAFSLPLIH